MDKFITKEDKNRIANRYGLEYGVLCAVMDVESAGSGFDPKTGLIKIQFEPYVFSHNYKEPKINNGVELQPAEWKAFNEAYRINPEDAMLSTSWGLGQIMGFNHVAAGYDKVEDMVKDFKESEYYQLNGMIRFICASRAMKEALVRHDWKTFAKYYNGINFQQFNYDSRLAAAYSKYNSN